MGDKRGDGWYLRVVTVLGYGNVLYKFGLDVSNITLGKEYYGHRCIN